MIPATTSPSTFSAPPAAHPGRRARRPLCAASLTTVLLLALCGCKKAADESPVVAVEVQVEHPTIAPIAESIAADAILAPLAQAALAPKITAPVRTFYVQRGSRVRKGQLLAVLESRDLQGSALDSAGGLAQAQASFAAATRASNPEEIQKARLDVDQAKANAQVARRTADERARLLAQGAIAGRDVDTAAAAAVQAEAVYALAVRHLDSVEQVTQATNVQNARGQLNSAQGRYQAAQAQVGYASLRSPIDGVVTDRPLFPGETAAAGAPLITVMDTTSLLAKLHLSEAAAQKLALGGQAEITVPGLDNPVRATVSLISPALDPGSTTVEVWLKLPNPDGKLEVGTPVHASITGITVPNALQIATSALLPAEDNTGSVMLMGSDGAAHKRSVTIGIRTPRTVQVLSGLSPADTVITEGAYGLDEATRVTVASSKSEDDKPGAGKSGEDKE